MMKNKLRGGVEISRARFTQEVWRSRWNPAAFSKSVMIIGVSLVLSETLLCFSLSEAEAKTSAPPAAATATATGAKERAAKIGSKPAVLRDRASVYGKKVFDVPAGATVSIVGEEGAYLKLRYLSPKGATHTGYVAKSALTIFESKAAALGTGQRVDMGPTEGAQGAGVRLGKTGPEDSPVAEEAAVQTAPGQRVRTNLINAAVPEQISNMSGAPPEPPPPNIEAEDSIPPVASPSPSPTPAAQKKKSKNKKPNKKKGKRKPVLKSGPDARLQLWQQISPEYLARWREIYGEARAAQVQDEELLRFMVEGGLESRVLQ
jgi:hypothetical protein